MKLATALTGFVLFGLAGCGTQRQKPLPTLYIVDSGRVGWVKIVYNRPDEKELPVANGFAVARIGADLKLFTHSRMNPSWDGSHFYYQAPAGKRVELSYADNPSRRIWAQEKTTDDAGERESFFVGNQEQFSQGLRTPGRVGAGLLVSPATPEPEHPKELDVPPNATKVLTELPKQ